MKERLTRRNFLEAAGAAIAGGLGLTALGHAFIDDAEKVRGFKEEREKTGGYQVEKLDDCLLQVQLLPSGKSSSPFWDGEDIRSKTFASALTEIRNRGFVVESITPIHAQEGLNSPTDSLLIKVYNCP